MCLNSSKYLFDAPFIIFSEVIIYGFQFGYYNWDE